MFIQFWKIFSACLGIGLGSFLLETAHLSTELRNGMISRCGWIAKLLVCFLFHDLILGMGGIKKSELLSFQVTQTVKRKAKEQRDYSPAGRLVFFPYVCLVQIQCFEKTLKVKVVTAMLKS